jgi:predicted RNase H-like HicB family nuclease
MTTTLVRSDRPEVIKFEGPTEIAVEYNERSVSDEYVLGEVAQFEGTSRIDDVEGVPKSLLKLYADLAVPHATARELDEGGWIATVAGLEGAYGEGSTATEAVADLRKTIISWVVVKRRIGASDIPLMEGLDLNPRDGSSNDEVPAPDQAE